LNPRPGARAVGVYRFSRASYCRETLGFAARGVSVSGNFLAVFRPGADHGQPRLRRKLRPLEAAQPVPASYRLRGEGVTVVVGS